MDNALYKNIYTLLDDDISEKESFVVNYQPIIEPVQPRINKKRVVGGSLTYEGKIKIIQEYFGISELCAIYLYHRRRRGIPWHKPSDPKYLEWSIQLQNAIICLDTITGFDWRGLEFGYEEIQFIKNNIDISKMPESIVVLSEVPNLYMKNSPDKDGFIKVEYNKINITRELNKMGFIPRNYCTNT